MREQETQPRKNTTLTRELPTWRIEAWIRWVKASEEAAHESSRIAAEAARQAGER